MHGDPGLLDKMEDLEQKAIFAERLRRAGVWKKGFKKLKNTEFQGSIETLWRKQLYKQAIDKLEQQEKESAYDRAHGNAVSHDPIVIPKLRVKKTVGKKSKAKPKPKPQIPKRFKQPKIKDLFKKQYHVKITLLVYYIS